MYMVIRITSSKGITAQWAMECLQDILGTFLNVQDKSKCLEDIKKTLILWLKPLTSIGSMTDTRQRSVWLLITNQELVF